MYLCLLFVFNLYMLSSFAVYLFWDELHDDIDSITCKSIATLLSAPSAECLSHIDLSYNCLITNEVFGILLNHGKCLENVVLKGTACTEEGVDTFVKARTRILQREARPVLTIGGLSSSVPYHQRTKALVLLDSD